MYLVLISGCRCNMRLYNGNDRPKGTVDRRTRWPCALRNDDDDGQECLHSNHFRQL